MTARKRGFRELFVSYRYPDGFEDGIGRMILSGDFWEIRYDRIEENRGAVEVEETTDFADDALAALLLLERWWDEQRKMDAHSLLVARQRISEAREPETGLFLTHCIYDAIVDNVVRKSHRVLDNAVAPWEWWETIGREYIPPAGFGCRCQPFFISRIRARKMIESGEAFDVTRGLPSEAIPDPRWRLWAATFNEQWDQSRKAGVAADEAKGVALSAAKRAIRFDPQSVRDAVVMESVD